MTAAPLPCFLSETNYSKESFDTRAWIARQSRLRPPIGDTHIGRAGASPNERNKEQELSARRDGVRGRDDVHRSDDRRHRDPQHPEGADALCDGISVGHQWLSVVARGAVRVRGQAGRRPRPAPNGRDRRNRLRRRVSALWVHAKGQCGPAMDHHLPRAPGRRGGRNVPGGCRHRRCLVPVARARQSDGDLLRNLGRFDRDRADRRRLSHAMDVAIDLLDQHPGRDCRPGLDLADLPRDRG